MRAWGKGYQTKLRELNLEKKELTGGQRKGREEDFGMAVNRNVIAFVRRFIVIGKCWE